MFKIPDGFNLDLPDFYEVRQHFDSQKVEDVEQAVIDELNRPEIRGRVKQGDEIAVAVGSRGVARIADIVKTIVSELKAWQCRPFIIPAMGSHGNAEAENQKKILEGYGLTEQNMGAPIRSSLEVEKIGEVGDGVPVYVDKIALHADGVIPVNRVKPHTDYIGDIESGIMKIMVIGMGNHKGATNIHYRGSQGLKSLIPEAARLILQKAPIVFGLATVENAYDLPCRIRAMLPETLEEEEKALLKVAKEKLPTFPLDDIDLLVVEEIGKNISGTGMDTNIIGRIGIWGVKEPEKPRINKIVALGLSEKTEGNAVGIGLADVVTERMVEEADFSTTYTNVIAGNCFQRGFRPLVALNDQQAITLGINYSRGWDPATARVVKIKNTLLLDKIEVSQAVWELIREQGSLELLRGPYAWKFNEEGFLLPG